MFCDELTDFLGNETNILKRIWFPDKTDYLVYVYANKHNILCWALEYPEISICML
jgi:hypothetical protein